MWGVGKNEQEHSPWCIISLQQISKKEKPLLYILFYHKYLGLGNVSLAFVKQDYFGEQSY